MKSIKKTMTILFPIILFCSVSQLCLAEEPYDTEEQGKILFTDNCSLCHVDSSKGEGVFS